MGRILFFLVIAFLVWLIVRVAGSRRRPEAPVEPRQPVAVGVVEPVAQCAWCGVHVPSGAAVSLPDGRIYCGPPHRDRALAAVPSSDRG